MARKILSRDVRFAKRSKTKRSAKPSRCPYCESTNISGGMGNYDCDDCGRSWSV